MAKIDKNLLFDQFLVLGRQKLTFSKINFSAVLNSTAKVKYVLEPQLHVETEYLIGFPEIWPEKCLNYIKPGGVSN